MAGSRSLIRRRALAGAIALTAVLSISACGEDGSPPLGSVERPGSTAPEGTTAPEPTPAPTAAPEPEAPPAQEAPATTTPAQSTDESLSTEEWIAVILVGLVVIGAIIAIVSLLRRHDDEPAASSLSMRLGEITRGSRAIHDSAVIRLLQTTDPTTMQSGWAVTQQQIVDLEQRTATLSGEVTDETARQTLQQLGSALAGVQGALGAYVGVQGDPSSADRPDLVQQAQQTVFSRNQQLDLAIDQAQFLQL